MWFSFCGLGPVIKPTFNVNCQIIDTSRRTLPFPRSSLLPGMKRFSWILSANLVFFLWSSLLLQAYHTNKMLSHSWDQRHNSWPSSPHSVESLAEIFFQVWHHKDRCHHYGKRGLTSLKPKVSNAIDYCVAFATNQLMCLHHKFCINQSLGRLGKAQIRSQEVQFQA